MQQGCSIHCYSGHFFPPFQHVSSSCSTFLISLVKTNPDNGCASAPSCSRPALLYLPGQPLRALQGLRWRLHQGRRRRHRLPPLLLLRLRNPRPHIGGRGRLLLRQQVMRGLLRPRRPRLPRRRRPHGPRGRRLLRRPGPVQRRQLPPAALRRNRRARRREPLGAAAVGCFGGGGGGAALGIIMDTSLSLPLDQRRDLRLLDSTDGRTELL